MLSKTVATLFQDIVSVSFPNNCVLCKQSLFESEDMICGKCIQGLPLTHYHKHADNPAVKLFWSRCEIQQCAPLYFLTKNNKVHDLIHLLKYRNKPMVGERLGKIIGANLIANESVFTRQDYIIPVPLHWKKERLRGYNQAHYIAKGIESVTKYPLLSGNLTREVENVSQTRKSKYERWENVEDIFRLQNPEVLANKNILLVDDVITTGSTLEACVHAIKKAEGVKVSIASIATAGS
jgi:ComF family protein